MSWTGVPDPVEPKAAGRNQEEEEEEDGDDPDYSEEEGSSATDPPPPPPPPSSRAAAAAGRGQQEAQDDEEDDEDMDDEDAEEEVEDDDEAFDPDAEDADADDLFRRLNDNRIVFHNMATYPPGTYAELAYCDQNLKTTAAVAAEVWDQCVKRLQRMLAMVGTTFMEAAYGPVETCRPANCSVAAPDKLFLSSALHNRLRFKTGRGRLSIRA